MVDGGRWMADVLSSGDDELLLIATCFFGLVLITRSFDKPGSNAQQHSLFSIAI